MSKSANEKHAIREIARLEKKIAEIGQPEGPYQERMLVLYRNLLDKNKKVLDRSHGGMKRLWEDYLQSHHR